MRLIFIGSYLNVPCVIDTVEREKEDFKILTADRGLLKLFAEFYGEEHTMKLPKLFESFGDFKSLLRDVVKSHKYKKQLLEVCRELKPTKIIFYFLGWNGLSSWLIKKLSVTSDVYYRPKVNVDMLKANHSLRMFTKTIIASCIYGIRFKSASYYGYPIIAIDKSFLDRVNARKYDHEIDTDNVRKFVKRKYTEFNNTEILLLTSGFYNIDINTYMEKMCEVHSIITNHYESNQICIKNHPNFPNIEFNFTKSCVVAPAETPANILCHTSKFVIGYDSATLYEAADTGLTSISLVYIIPSTSPNQAERVSAYLMDNSVSKDILFPKDLDELNTLLMEQS